MAKKKIKPILPSLREKKRYLAFEIISKSKIAGYDAVEKSIFEKSAEFLGQLGMARAGMIFLKDKWNQNLQRGLIRVNNKHVDELRAALTLIKEINNNETIVRSIGVSGILKKANKKYLSSSAA